MRDISNLLDKMTNENDCSPFKALLLLSNKEVVKDGIHILQPKSSQETSR